MAPVLQNPSRRTVSRPLDDPRYAPLYLSGLSGTQVAAACGVSGATVIRWLRRAGVPVRPRGRPLRMAPEVSRDDILALLQAGLTYARAAAKLGMSLRALDNRARLPRRAGSPRAHRCACCAGRAQLWHHTSYVPEQFVALCRRCHTRVHHAAAPPKIRATPQLHRRD